MTKPTKKKKETVKIYLFVTIATTVFNSLAHILYGGLVIEFKMCHYVSNTIEHEVCLCYARTIAVLLGVLGWHVELSALS